MAAILLLGLLCCAGNTRASVLGAYNVKLGWNASTGPTVVGYRIYYGTTSGSYSFSTDVGDSTTAVVPGLASGVSYYFAVTAYDQDGSESPFSQEVRFVAGQPNLQLSVAPHGPAALTASGTIGHTYDIQTSSDMVNWTSIGTVNLGTANTVNYTDPNAGNFPTRFYRMHDTQL